MVVFAVSEWAVKLTASFDRRKRIACFAASALGTVAHTVMVMGMIYLLYGGKISQMINSGTGVPAALTERGVGLGIATLAVANGLPEVIVACVIAPVIVLALRRAFGAAGKA